MNSRMAKRAATVVWLGMVSSVLGNDILKDLRPDTWYRAPKSAMRGSCPSETQFPGIRAVGGCAMEMEAWSGGAYDETGRRLWVWGGGHGDYHGNEIYAFSLDSLKWTRVTDPSPITTLSVDPMPDGSPVSRHTYDGLAFLTHANRFFAYGGSMAGNGYGTQVTWTFDPAAKDWRNMLPAASENRPGTACCNFSGEYDPATRKVYMRDPNWLCAYDYDKNAWSRIRSWEHTWNPGKAVIDTKRKLLFTIGSKEFLVYDIAADKDVSADWKTSGGDSLINGYGVGAAYDSRSDRLVGWVGGGVYALAMDTKVWSRMSSTGAPAAPLADGTYGRFRYVPGDDVFILANGVDEDVYFYKPGYGSSLPVMPRARAPRALRPHVRLADDRIQFDHEGGPADLPASPDRGAWRDAAGRQAHDRSQGIGR